MEPAATIITYRKSETHMKDDLEFSGRYRVH